MVYICGFVLIAHDILAFRNTKGNDSPSHEFTNALDLTNSNNKKIMTKVFFFDICDFFKDNFFFFLHSKRLLVQNFNPSLIFMAQPHHEKISLQPAPLGMKDQTDEAIIQPALFYRVGS